jgi:hypothetical protein
VTSRGKLISGPLPEKEFDVCFVNDTISRHCRDGKGDIQQ